MAPQKRKAAQPVDDVNPPVKKRGRPPLNPTTVVKSASAKGKKPSADATATSARSTRASGKPASTDATSNKKGVKEKPTANGTKAAKADKDKVVKKKPVVAAKSATKNKKKATAGRRKSEVSIEIPAESDNAADAEDDDDEEVEEADGPAYWLMKAEPESRMEKGKEVKFSIDDLKNAAQQEAWDGVRNATARNNMRAMLKGDLAFFYHSNCKVPGIVGIMEIVQEHSVDESAFDPDHPYYDAKSTRESPKWCVVHVEFRQKFAGIVKLKEMQKYAREGGVLERMQTLKQSRLSVSKVSKKEWDFVMSLADLEGTAAAVAGEEATAD